MIKTIKLNDGIEVEVEINDNQAYEISDGGVVNSSIDKMQDLLLSVMKPIGNIYKKIDENMAIDKLKVTVGVKIGIEGNFILAKSSAAANIQVEMEIKPKN